jgi:hypothetical protein
MIPHENRTIVIYKGAVKFPGAGEVGDPALEVDGRRVAYNELDAWYTERMMFDWRGQPFHLNIYRDGRVQGGYSGFDSSWAREQGLEGSGYAGWLCDVPESEVENLRVEKTDLLETWRYRETFGVEPPTGLFTDVRPANDQEWIRE